jgi:hypothetical protein
MGNEEFVQGWQNSLSFCSCDAMWSLDRQSGGQAGVGAGTGWLAPEDSLGVHMAPSQRR